MTVRSHASDRIARDFPGTTGSLHELNADVRRRVGGTSNG